MTMQMTDTFFYQGEKAEAIAISHRFSFSPANAFGIKAIKASSDMNHVFTGGNDRCLFFFSLGDNDYFYM